MSLSGSLNMSSDGNDRICPLAEISLRIPNLEELPHVFQAGRCVNFCVMYGSKKRRQLK